MVHQVDPIKFTSLRIEINLRTQTLQIVFVDVRLEFVVPSYLYFLDLLTHPNVLVNGL